MSAGLKVLKSGFLLLSTQLLQRGLGIISTLILARLLTPEHFGIVALIVIALQFFELLVETGTQQYIIQKSQLTNEDLDTAWTIDILSKAFLAVLIIVFSPQIAVFFDTPELAIPLSISALALPLKALKTPGLMKLAREINYSPLFKLTLWQKGLSFISVMSVAVVHPSHWAIIIGNLVSALVMAIGSYQFSQYRPKWSLTKWRKQWSFSKWLLARGFVGFTRSQIDSILVSKIFGTKQLGGYNLVRELSLLPAVSVINPMAEPLLAAIAQSKHNRKQLQFRVRVSLWIMISVLLPISLFIVAYPELIVLTLLGTRWQEYAALLQPFGLAFFSFPLFALICDAMLAQGKTRLLFYLDIISTTIIIGALVLFATQSLHDIAWYRAILAIVTVFAYLGILNHQVDFKIGKLLFLCLPSLFGSIFALYLTNLVCLDTCGTVVEFLLRGTLFVVLSLSVTLIIANFMIKSTYEWKHAKGLLTQTFQNFTNKNIV